MRELSYFQPSTIKCYLTVYSQAYKMPFEYNLKLLLNLCKKIKIFEFLSFREILINLIEKFIDVQTHTNKNK